MNHLVLQVLISLLGLKGFLIASYIHRKKLGKKKLICPMRSNCETVIHSDYSKILGINVEILGMSYYFLVSIMYAFLNVLNFYFPNILWILLAFSGCSVLFSIYLLSVQTFIIRHWCIWCLFSALISVLIFFLSYLNLVW